MAKKATADLTALVKLLFVRDKKYAHLVCDQDKETIGVLDGVRAGRDTAPPSVKDIMADAYTAACAAHGTLGAAHATEDHGVLAGTIAAMLDR